MLLAATLTAASCASFLVTSAVPASAEAAGTTFSTTAESQIAALQRIKTSETPTERKLDSRLVVAARQQQNRAATSATPKVTTGVTTAADGTTEVDITVTALSKDLSARLAGVGATVRYSSAQEASIRAALPVSALRTVAGWKDVVRVAVAARAMTSREVKPGTPPETKQQRATAVAAQLRQALAVQQKAGGARATPDNPEATPQTTIPQTTSPQITSPQGSVVSEGDKAEAVDKARRTTHVTGIGVKVCVLSDGVDSLAAAQATGDLPASVDVLPDQAGSGDEGTAMLEIIHDLAPGATLGFATAFISAASFADNIRALRSTAHCTIIVDDIEYFDESPFQDGPIAQAVNAVTADGALYFSSAGNEGNVVDGTSGNYEGDFHNSGKGVGKFAGQAHDFDPGSGVQIYEPLSDNSNVDVPVTLNWADPLGKAADDYDLYLLDATGAVVSFSQDVQDGTENPYESLQTPDEGGTGLRLAVVKFAGADRYFQLSAIRGRFSPSADGLKAFVTPGVTKGHSAAVNAFSVAAAPAAGALPFSLEPGDPANPTGPYPGVFTKNQKPERFTSDGPRRVFFQADGTPVTPGNTTHTGGTVRQKPDITAADGVSTSLSDFTPFFGTSAAAPHAAAIAALVVSGNPGATRSLVAQAFDATALDLAPTGVDNRTGHGLILADAVLAYTGTTPQPLVQAGKPGFKVTSGDGDAYFEPGETATVFLPAVDVGDGDATGVSLRVSGIDPKVSVTPTAMAYGTVKAGTTVWRKFTVTLPKSYPLGKPVALSIQTTFAGRLSPTTGTMTVPTGQPASTYSTVYYKGPAVPIPDNSETGASVTFAVSGMTYASGLLFTIDGRDCTTAAGSGIDHTFVGDLVGTLSTPSGATATLFDRDNGSGDNMCQVTFSDGASVAYSTLNSTDAPFTGRWLPQTPLAALLAGPVSGTWTFHVVDQATGDTGSIRAVSLHLRGYAAP